LQKNFRARAVDKRHLTFYVYQHTYTPTPQNVPAASRITICAKVAVSPSSRFRVQWGSVMSHRGTKMNVLFLGNGNAARSIMAEAILNHEGRDKFQAYSAGINAHVELDQRAVDLLKRSNFDLAGVRPKNWTEFAGDEAPRFDFIFTVCEGAALLPHSVWPASPIFAHWGVPNPAFAEGSEAEVRLAYADAFRMLANRIGIFVSLPLRSADIAAMQCQLDLIGKNGATPKAVVAA
jgi:arsenate reductase (thioredoxin)